MENIREQILELSKEYELKINWKENEKPVFGKMLSVIAQNYLSELGRKRTILLCLSLIVLCLDLLDENIPSSTDKSLMN